MKYVLLTVLAVLLLNVPFAAQDCKPPAIVFNAKTENIFTPEQEMVLGDLVFRASYSEMRYVNDERLLAYVRAIGAKLINHLPPTGLEFQFHIIDYPEANAFNIPGGHVFLSRKLIAFARNEDELAGVIAHELGHATVHHGATDLSAMLKKILNVTSVGDRKDISDKFNRLIESYRTKRFSRKSGHEDGQQLEADRIGLFAMVAAGYDSAARASYFERLIDSKPKSGGWFSDIFGTTSPEQKRLREMTKGVEQLPAACRESGAAGQKDEFLKWQANVVSFAPRNRPEVLPGLLYKKELSPKLRSDVSRLIVSSSGRYLVARDDYSITVMEREPLKVLFQIPVEDVDELYVSTDEKYIVFKTSGLRFERWSIPDQKAVEAHELVPRGNCIESSLSSDGNYLACIDTDLSATIFHVPTGDKIFEKKSFYQLNIAEYYDWVYSDYNDLVWRPFFRIQFTPDSAIAVFSRSNFYRVDPRRVGITSGILSHDTTLAVNIAAKKAINTGGDLDNVLSRSYAFLDPTRVIGMSSSDATESGIFSFPEGRRLKKFSLYANEIEATGNPDYFVIRPLLHTTLGVFDVKTAQIVIGLNKEDAAVWKNQFIFESAAGKMVIREMTGAGAETSIEGPDHASLDLPSAAIGDLRAAQISNNFRWLALSSTTRGGLWDMADGGRKLYVTGFRGGIVGDDGASIAEFPKFDKEKHSLVLLNPKSQTAGVVRDLPDAGAKQFGKFALIRTSLSEKPEKEKEKKDEVKGPELPRFDDVGVNLRENVRYEVKDVVQDKVIWSRDFPKVGPTYAFDGYSGRIIFYWYLGFDWGKAKLKENPELAAKAQALGNMTNDYLIEVFDPQAGKQLGSLLLETGKGSFNVGSGMSEGDWLVLYDSEDRVLVYSIATGELRQRFFGRNAALNPGGNELAVENFPGEITIYDLTTGDAKGAVTIPGRASFVRFNADGSRLFILSSIQTGYILDPKAVTKPRLP